MRRTFRWIFRFLPLWAGLLAAGCSVPGTGTPVGTWGMVSGSVRQGGVFTVLDPLPEEGFYKRMTFTEEGTFTQTGESLAAAGTYRKHYRTIDFSFTDYPDSCPEWFAIRRTGAWTFKFLDEDTLWLYDYSIGVEVAMTLVRIPDDL